LQQDIFPGRAAWPIALLTAGMALMIAASNYAPLKVRWMGLAKIRRSTHE
jgi:hypothetical protein